jgi:hypothetical protein
MLSLPWALSLGPPAQLCCYLYLLSLIVCRASIYARTIQGDLQQIVPRRGHPWRFWLMETDPRPAWVWIWIWRWVES